MPLVECEHLADRRLFSRRGLVISLSILALAVSLARRSIHVSFHLKTTAHSVSAYAKVQHRDKDAPEWVPPAASRCLLWVTEFSTGSEPSEEAHFHDSALTQPLDYFTYCEVFSIGAHRYA